MNRFFTSKSSASSSSAVQPALGSASASSSSAVQPAMLNSLDNVQRWLSTEEVLSSNLDTCPVREAVAVLTRTPRPRQEEVQPLQRK